MELGGAAILNLELLIMTVHSEAGLCARCSHSRVIESGRGSRFWMCQLHRVDESFAKYPRLPVLQCRGFEARDAPI
jgi:hypothetical protein